MLPAPSPDSLYGTWKKPSATKKSWNLPQPKMANTDLSALLKSEAIRAVLRAPDRKVTKAVIRTNPLKNIRSMLQLNPYAAVVKKNAELTKEKNLRAKVGGISARSFISKPMDSQRFGRSMSLTRYILGRLPSVLLPFRTRFGA